MPRTCCVPGCRSNYKAGKKSSTPSSNVATFSFPRDETLRQKWIRKIDRDDVENLKHPVVCIKHFNDQFIVKEDVMKRPDGTVLRVKRDIVKLIDNAYPTIFLEQPHYNTEEISPRRKDTEERRQQCLKGSVNDSNGKNMEVMDRVATKQEAEEIDENEKDENADVDTFVRETNLCNNHVKKQFSMITDEPSSLGGNPSVVHVSASVASGSTYDEHSASQTSLRQCELDMWAKSLASQLSSMEIIPALQLQLKIQTLITKERIRYERNKMQ